MKKANLFRTKRTSGGFKFDGNAHIKAMYDTSEWSNFSKRFLEQNPRCYSCGEKSQAVDHVKAHKGDVELFEKPDNMIPLCHKCHNTVTALFDRFPTQKIFDKLNWLGKNRERNMLTFKVYVIPYRNK